MNSPHRHVATLRELTRLLAEHGGPERCLLVDLALGSWYPHSAARQLAAQLGVATTLPALAYGEHPGGEHDIRYGGRISGGIDVEAAGDAGILAAARLADEISAAIDAETTVLVLVPRPPGTVPFVTDPTTARAETGLYQQVGRGPHPPAFGRIGHWAHEDEYFLRFLRRRLGAGRRVVLVGSGGLADPGPEPFGLIPGLLDPVLALALRADATALTHLPALRGGFLPVPPEWRPAGPVTPACYDALAARSGGVSWLRAYAQYHGDPGAAEVKVLAGQGWSALREGAGGLAVRLARRAVSCARNPLERAALLAGLQAMHIALCRYADAASAEDPGQDLPDPLRGFLSQAKGWGLTMSSDAAENARAEGYLTQARRLLGDSVGERELLYLGNITALARLKAGHPRQALADEREIERRAARLRPRDHRLEYVNAINQARLYRRLGDHPAARRYYQRAFATVDGLRTDSDAVHANVCLARVAGAAGLPDEARRCWLRAALHWLSTEVPEALAWRVVTAIAGHRDTPDIVTTVAEALADRLEAPAPGGGAAPEFVRHRDGDPPPRWAAMGNGWSVFGVRSSPRPPVRDSGPDTLRRLRERVHALLLADCPDRRLANADLLAVPDNQGRELPVATGELIGAGLLAGTRTFLLPDGVIELSEPDAAAVTARFRFRIGPAVARIDSDRTVHFRRYRPPLRLGPKPRRAELIAARVLVAELPEDAWKRVGTKPRSSENCPTS
ncbi:hypothetical protein [Amycolatopsis pigmentata]|uniref:Tetratricopeptide repeat protein n=1 Tax=Amycolatopsis pigmentata TaxID=450801 RepID=A0ABW5FPV7_9PSEU